jgi:hypothetical protein
MTLDEAIETLEKYQSWRMGCEDSEMIKPRVITIALDVVIKIVKESKTALPNGGYAVEGNPKSMQPTFENDKS